MHPDELIPPRKPSWALANAKSFYDLNYADLKKTHELFVAPWGGKDEGLTKQEFCDVVKKTVCCHMTDDEIEALHSRINANNVNKICWSDFINCAFQKVLEHDRLETTLLRPPLFEPDVKFVHTRHVDPIVAICFVPRLDALSTVIDFTKGRYYMLGREGILSIWTVGISLLGYHCVGADSRIKYHLSYVDIIALYPSSMVAIISTERNLAIWDVGSQGIEYKYCITPLSNCPTCLDYWADLIHRSHSLLFWGDTAGDVHCLEFNVGRKEAFFISLELKEGLTKINYNDLLRGKVPDVRLYKVTNVMRGWVKQVCYLPNWDTFLACSLCKSGPLSYAEFRGRKRRGYYVSRKGVTSIDFSSRMTIIVAGCLDAMVRLWNVFILGTPVGILRGHRRSIVAVAVRDATEHVISLDKGHTVNVYHLVTHQCIQRFTGTSMTPLGAHPTTGHYYNVGRNEFLLANTVIARTTPVPNYTDQLGIFSHNFPLVGVAYSSEFRKVVSVCQGGVITVWDVYTGTPTLQFRHYSPRTPEKDVVYEPENMKIEITAFLMDQTERRIVTGAADGTINLWNFSSGLLIKHYSLPEAVVVTAIVMDKMFIYAAGWHKKVYILNTEAKGCTERFQFLRQVHKEDILCMTLLHPSMLVTASYDGDIIVVSRETGNTILRMNACNSRYPITMDRLGKYTTPTGQVEQVLCKVEEADESHADVFDVLTGCYVTREESDAQIKNFENSVDAMLILPTRQPSDDRTATLITAGNEGWIRAWSLQHKGGLLGQFAATKEVGEMVLVMTTDPQNEFLITGDTQGYVKVWDLLLYCNRAAEFISDKELKARDDVFLKKFYFFRSTLLTDEAANGIYSPHKRPPPLASEPESTLKIPRLLNVFRAHPDTITCITYVPSRELLITGSAGKMVRLWLLSGRYIGTCGDPWPGLISPEKTMVRLRQLPLELRRCASARTFKVTNVGARNPLWETAFALVKEHLRRSFALRKRPAVADKEYSVQQVQRIEKKMEMVEVGEKLKAVKGKITDIVVNRAWHDPRKSSILGSTFRPNLHYKSRPNYSSVDMNKCLGQFPAYRMMPIHDLDNVNISIPSFGNLFEQRKSPKRQSKTANLWKQSRQRVTIEHPRIHQSVALNKTNNARLPPLGTAENRVTPLMGDKVSTALGAQNGSDCLTHLPSADDSISDREHWKLSSRIQTRCESSASSCKASYHLPPLAATSPSLD